MAACRRGEAAANEASAVLAKHSSMEGKGNAPWTMAMLWRSPSPFRAGAAEADKRCYATLDEQKLPA